MKRASEAGLPGQSGAASANDRHLFDAVGLHDIHHPVLSASLAGRQDAFAGPVALGWCNGAVPCLGHACTILIARA